MAACVCVRVCVCVKEERERELVWLLGYHGKSLKYGIAVTVLHASLGANDYFKSLLRITMSSVNHSFNIVSTQ